MILFWKFLCISLFLRAQGVKAESKTEIESGTETEANKTKLLRESKGN
jgi:hypothetical protein